MSDYPGKLGREAYAVGLDTPASVAAIVDDLRAAGYAIDELPPAIDLMTALTGTAGASLALADYRRLLDDLPDAFVERLMAHWGDPASDAAVIDGAFAFRALRAGNLVLALQPDRGHRGARQGDYHDAALPPRHGYVAFYLWLRHCVGIHALVHCGTHGTLEWLPGKAVALDHGCAPEALLGPTPLVYPFIVNNPGEAAQAKRRGTAVIVGHMTPPLKDAGAHGTALEIEALFDEYAAAETLDPKRAQIIGRTLIERAGETGLAAESGIDLARGQSALTALDAWLCDIKEMRIRDGLHVFGRGADAACAAGERDGLLAALDGRFVPGGPAGAPSRGRADVLPTGRNLYGTDPRAVPSRTAMEIGRRAADAVAERYAQDHGDWPSALVLDLWASATMRTGGEDLAQAFAHLGVRPQWDAGSARDQRLRDSALRRPVAATRRRHAAHLGPVPRRVSDADCAVRPGRSRGRGPRRGRRGQSTRRRPTQGHRRPATDLWGRARPLRHRPRPRDRCRPDGRARRSRARLPRRRLARRTAVAEAEGLAADDAFAARVAGADAYVHVRDMADLDTLDAQANVEAEGGFAAAAHALGKVPALYHLDASSSDSMTVRTQAEEIARVVRGRAGNPGWIAGQMRHGHRGAAEIAETVDNLYALAVMSDAVRSRQFDLVFAATCGAQEVRDFLRAANPDAARAIASRFRDAATRGFWTSRRNSDAATLADMLAPA